MAGLARSQLGDDMQDTRRHYPKDVLTWGLLPGVWKTTATMCGKRRKVDLVTDDLALLTCGECADIALAYWREQVKVCRDLISYAEQGKLKGTSAERESGDLLPKIREALEQAETNVHKLAETMAARWEEAAEVEFIADPGVSHGGKTDHDEPPTGNDTAT